MDWPRRKLVTILDSGTIAGGIPPVEPPIFPEAGLGVWYKADRGTYTNTAAQFVGSSFEYLQAPNHSSLALGNTPWAVGGWVYLDSPPYNGTASVIFSKYGTSLSEVDLQLYLLSGQTLQFNFWNGATHPNTAGPALSFGSWHFVVAHWDPAGGGTGFFYVDGVEQPHYPAQGTRFPSTAPVRLGVGSPGDNYYTNCRMQDWFLFQRTLSIADCAYLWNGGNGRPFGDLDLTFRSSLGAWWPLNELSGTRRDVSGNNNTLADINTVLTNTGKVASQAVSDGALIPVWQDSSAGNWHLTSTTGAPTLQADELNGKPVVRFDGIDDRMATAPMLGSVLAAPQKQTVFVVQKQLSTNANPVTYSWDSHGGAGNEISAHLKLAGTLYHIVGAAIGGGFATAAAPEPFYETWHLIEMVRTGTGGDSIGVDGNFIATNQNPGTLDVTQTAILRVSDRAYSGAPYVFQGDIAELIIFNRVLDAGERTAVRNYLMNKWGIAQNKLIVTSTAVGYLRVNTNTNDRLALN